jgi:hypothetical protein
MEKLAIKNIDKRVRASMKNSIKYVPGLFDLIKTPGVSPKINP